MNTTTNDAPAETTAGGELFVYFVSYVITNPYGAGSTTVSTARRIDTGPGIDEITEHLSQLNGGWHVVLTSITPLSAPAGACTACGR